MLTIFKKKLNVLRSRSGGRCIVLVLAAVTVATSLSAGPVACALEQQTIRQTTEGPQLPPGDSTQKSGPAALINGSSIGSRLSLKEVRQLLDLHNRVRSDAGAGPLNWSGEIAMHAQEWADHLASAGCKMEHRPNSGKWKKKYGENLFMGTSGFYGVADAVTSWESEKKYYKGGVLNSSNWYASGHYTQVIWKNSLRVGCARAECNNGMMIVVCNYDPPGNVLGQKP